MIDRLINLVVGSINTSIPQTSVNKVTDNKLGKDDKDKRFSSKCQTFIWRINIKKCQLVNSWIKMQSE